MSGVRFQDQLGQSLRKVEGLFTYHPPDGVASSWKPGDWMFGRGPEWGIVEAKQTRNRTFNLRDWTAQQRGFCRDVEAAGGLYWLVVNWRPAGLQSPQTICRAFSGGPILGMIERGRTSIQQDEDLGVRVPWSAGGWDVASFLAAED